MHSKELLRIEEKEGRSHSLSVNALVPCRVDIRDIIYYNCCKYAEFEEKMVQVKLSHRNNPTGSPIVKRVGANFKIDISADYVDVDHNLQDKVLI